MSMIASSSHGDPDSSRSSLHLLLDAFGSHFSLDEIAAVYSQANQNVDEASEILLAMATKDTPQTDQAKTKGTTSKSTYVSVPKKVQKQEDKVYTITGDTYGTMEHMLYYSDSDDDEYVSAAYDVSSTEDGSFSGDEGSYDVDDVHMELVPPPTPIYSYVDGFQLYGFPQLKLGECIGIVGSKLAGKTTLLNILAGKIIPNLCMPEKPPNWEAVTERLHLIKDNGAKQFCSYLANIRSKELKVSVKTQIVSMEELVEMQPQQSSHTAVQDLFAHHNPFKLLEMCQILGIEDKTLKSLPTQLTKAALQIVKIAAALLKEAHVYVLDEPSTYLNMKEKLAVCHAILSTVAPNRYVVVADKDVSMIEYISKCVFKLDGTPSQIAQVKPHRFN